jgi:hypothetical protein
VEKEKVEEVGREEKLEYIHHIDTVDISMLFNRIGEIRTIFQSTTTITCRIS